MKIFIVIICVWLFSQCGSVPVEYSVVSVYTTQPTTAETTPALDVYHQIANNIAERITSPIYRFLGYNTTSTATPHTSTMNSLLSNTVEIIDESEFKLKKDMAPIDNNIGKGRDVEELSVEGINKKEKKPEKLTLYSSLLPTSWLTVSSANTTEDLDSTELTEVELDATEKPREGPFIYVMEFLGSILQLLWGGFMALFRPPNNQYPTPGPT